MDSILAGGLLGLPGGSEWLVIIIVGLLLFGRRLPEVGRSLGKTIVEFKKGIRGIEDEIEQSSKGPSPSSSTTTPQPPPPNPQAPTDVH